MSRIEFFMPMIPPTVTAQEKKIDTRGAKPRVYEPEALRAARSKLTAHLAMHAPGLPMEGAVRLVVKWCWPVGTKHTNGEWKVTRPDTDNLAKMLKDCMTVVGFWKDDAQVASEITEKFWAEVPGIFISVEELT